jgi:hypothetical protein
MLKHALWTILSFLFLTCGVANAQNLCPAGTASDKLVCLIPQVYGVNGLPVQAVSFGGAPISTHFQNVLPDSLSPLNSALARQSAVLPLASPSSGITFSWDPTAKVFLPSTESLGPILGERAETLGQYRVFLGFSYQYFKFGDLDGVNLNNLPSVFLQPDDPNAVPNRVCSVNGDNQTECGFIRDVIKTANSVDLKVHQFTTFVTFGLTNRIDVSMAIPIENVRMSVFSKATIIDNLDATGTTFAHTFPFRTGCGSLTTPVQPCSNQSFSSVRTASGIGDITLRVKGKAWKGERAGLALGVDVRVPTGDSLNFLGAGAAGVKPFVVWSYRSRFSPHVSVGYEVNGSSKIAGDITTGVKEKLPGRLTYSGGADVWITKRLTAGFDLVGQQVFQARRISMTSVTEPAACLDSTGQCDPAKGFANPNVDPAVTQSTGTYNVTYASVGGKFRPFSNLLITGNVLLKLNDGGLGAKAIPLVGVSYTF